MLATSELKWLGRESILPKVPVLICWLKGEGCKDLKKDGATGRKKPGLLKAWWKHTQ